MNTLSPRSTLLSALTGCALMLASAGSFAQTGKTEQPEVRRANASQTIQIIQIARRNAFKDMPAPPAIVNPTDEIELYSPEEYNPKVMRQQ